MFHHAWPLSVLILIVAVLSVTGWLFVAGVGCGGWDGLVPAPEGGRAGDAIFGAGLKWISLRALLWHPYVLPVSTGGRGSWRGDDPELRGI
jgi:hypothetical protein